MPALKVPMFGAFFLLNNTNISLYVGTAVIGSCAGAISSISVSTTTELFGTKNFGINHNLVLANIPIDPFLFGDLAALVCRKQWSCRKDGRCMGMECYQITFTVWGFLCFLGSLLALVLHARTKKLYAQGS
ncbi:hypothetical protein NMG60_11014429 [Bertholletia excelsa]